MLYFYQVRVLLLVWEPPMITFEISNVRFTYRVSGIVLHDDHILLQRCQNDHCWFPPGGRAELMETTEETLLREMQEELGVEVSIERLLWVTENFFKHKHKSFHELCFYFLMTLPPKPELLTKDTPIVRYDQGCRIIFDWLPLATLSEITLYPPFITTELQNLPHTVKHIVHIDKSVA